MKIALLIFSILIIEFSTHSQLIKRESNKITFPVSNVAIAKNFLKETSYKQALEMRLDSKIEGYPLTERRKNLVPTHIHAFVSALHIAFAQHRPMAISPDMIWLMICQGAAIHINKNQDLLRSKLVDFEGKKEIKIRRDYFKKGNENNDWAGIFPEFCDSIQKYLKDSLYQQFVPEFTTTGLKEKNAFEVALMDVMSSYFDYTLETFCGIPEIILEGSVEDWKWIATNSKNLEKIGMKNWSDNLHPILNEFVKASQGEVDSVFWQSIYRQSSSCGFEITGWFVKFFPYILKNNEFHENSLLEGNKFAYSGLSSEMFPTGVSKVDLKWLDYTRNKTYNMQLYSGFIGIEQDRVTKTLKPEISWAVFDTENNKKESGKNKSEETDGFYPRMAILDTVIIPWEESIRVDSEMFHWESETKNSDIDYPKMTGPILFPDRSKSFSESCTELNTYIKTRLNGKRFKIHATIEFDVLWNGIIDNISILESDKPEFNNQIISIIKEIKGCQPAKNGKMITNASVFVELK